MARTRVIVLAICVVAAMAWHSEQSMAISIEREQPVRVTNRNSGPRYELEDDVERTKLSDSTPTTTDNNSNQDDKRNTVEQPTSGDSDAPTPIGHMSIRRIFLVPMMSGPRPDWQSAFSSSNEQPQDKDNSNSNQDSSQPGDNMEQQQPGLLTRPFWPFLTPPIRSPAHHQHLFGADESSRPLPTATDREREGDSMLTSGSINNNNNDNSNDQPPMGHAGARPMFDPIQMMIDMMHAALSGQLAPAENPLHDLANEANSLPRPDVSVGGDNNNNNNGDGDRPSLVTDLIRRPLKPASNNETKEDIVEIDGKKFLRKVVINRHVGENIVFMTKRLIFTPLNETTSTATTESAPTTATTTTTTVAPNTNGPVGEQENATANKPQILSIDKVDKPVRDEDEPTTTTTTTTTTTATSEQPSTTTTTTAAPPTTTASDRNSNEEPTTSPTSSASSPTTTTTTAAAQPEDTTAAEADRLWVARLKDAIGKAAERMMDDAAKLSTASTTTDKPAATLIESDV